MAEPTPKQREEREEEVLVVGSALSKLHGDRMMGGTMTVLEEARYILDRLDSLRTHSPEEQEDGLADRLDALFRSLIRNGADPAVVGEAGGLVHRLLQRSPEEPVGWRLIETAPKDGTPLLLYSKLYGHAAAYWNGAWVEEAHGPSLHESFNHWMPLPEPPLGQPLRRADR